MNILYADITSCLRSYSEAFPDENLADLQKIVGDNANIWSRQNLAGHVTASGIVLHEGKMLLIYHNKLQKLIQPGGHLDEEDARVSTAAQREILEETGIVCVQSALYPIDVPFHIDIQDIPENTKKHEPAHKHYDFWFLFATNDSRVKIREKEVSSFEWVSVDQNFDDPGLQQAVLKLRTMLKSH